MSANTPTLPTPQRLPARPAPPGPPGPGGPGGGFAGPSIDPVRVLRTYWPLFVGAFVFACIVGVGAFFLLGRYMPQYTAIAEYRVQPVQDADAGGEATLGAGNDDELEIYAKTQARIITSDAVLEQVATSPLLRQTEWVKQFYDGQVLDKKKALKALRDIVSAVHIGDTHFLRISVRAARAQDAQIIADVTHQVFTEINRRQTTQSAQRRLANYESRLEANRNSVEELNAQMANLLSGNEITGLTEEKQATFIEIQQIQPELVAIRQAIASSDESLQQYQDLIGGEGATFQQGELPVGFVYPESVRAAAENSRIVQNFESRIANLEATIASQREEFGENSRVIRRLLSEKRSLENQRAVQFQQEQASIFAAQLDNLRRQVRVLRATERELMNRLSEAEQRQKEVTLILREHDALRSDRNQRLRNMQQLEDLRTEQQLILAQGSRVRLQTPPDIPDARSFPQPIPVLAGAIALIVGPTLGLVVLKELREQRVRSPQDIASIPRTRVLGIIPEIGLDPARPARAETACIDAPEGAIAEAVRQIRTTLLKAINGQGSRSIVLTSGMPGSGTTSIACNLAANLASVDKRVLLVDANLRRPAVHRVFELDEGPGLAEVLAGEASLEDAVRPIADVPGFDVLTAGVDRRHGYERFTTDAMAELIERAKATYDVVVFDSPPAIVSHDASVLASHCDHSMLVVRAYGEKRGLVARVRNQLADAQAAFLGVVVNAVKPTAGGYFKRNFQATLDYQDDPSPKRVANTASKNGKNKALPAVDTTAAPDDEGDDASDGADGRPKA